MAEEIVERQKQIGTVPINYVKVGSGPQVLLFLPGTLGTWETDFGDLLRELDRSKYTMVCWDPPGYGRSRPFYRDFTTTLNKEDAVIAHQLMQYLKLDQYVVIGWSEGGRVAYELAALYPDSVQKVVTWGTVVDSTQETFDAFKQTADLSIWPKQNIELMTKIYGRKYFEELWKRYIDQCEDMLGESMCKESLRDIKQPVLVMYGSFDRIMGEKSAYYRNIAENLLPNGRFLLREGANHGFHKQPKHKQWFKDTVEAFLAEA